MPTAASSSHAKPTGLDERFLRRVHRANLGLTVLFGLLTLFAFGATWGVGFTAFGLWSTANLWVLERLLRASIRPEGRDATTIAVVAVVKMPILYGALIALLWLGSFPGVSIVAGLSVPMVVIFLKALGRVVSGDTSASASTSAPTGATHPTEPRS